MDSSNESRHAKLRVSDAEREEVAGVLREALAEGRLTMVELDERLTKTYEAKTYGELEAVTADLGPVPPRAPVRPASPQPPRFPAERLGGTPSRSFSISIMGGSHRGGSWVVPERYTAVTVMGGIVLDLRQARFAGGSVRMRALSVMGGIEIVVPEDVGVEVTGIGIMGSVVGRQSQPGTPGAPVVRVVGVSVMGGIKVRRRPPGGDEPGGDEPDALGPGAKILGA